MAGRSSINPKVPGFRADRDHIHHPERWFTSQSARRKKSYFVRSGLTFLRHEAVCTRANWPIDWPRLRFIHPAFYHLRAHMRDQPHEEGSFIGERKNESDVKPRPDWFTSAATSLPGSRWTCRIYHRIPPAFRSREIPVPFAPLLPESGSSSTNPLVSRLRRGRRNYNTCDDERDVVWGVTLGASPRNCASRDADARTLSEKKAVLWHQLTDHINDGSESWKYVKYTNAIAAANWWLGAS